MAESALGIPTASLLSNGISSAITGALAGSVFGVPGAAVGGVLGLGAGLVSGATEIWGSKDDAFKDYYGGLYEDVKGRSKEMVEGGSSIAAGRETDRISFKTLFGDKDTASSYLEGLVDMANHTPFLYSDLTAMSKTLASYGYSADKNNEDYILDALQVIGDTGAALGMGTGDMTAVAQALGRMKSSDKTTLEYLNILNDRGIGAVGYLADAKGVSVGDMYGMISKGEISGSEAVKIITEALEKAYFGSMEEQSKTFSGITSTLEGLEQELENAGGDAYNTLRQSGKSAMVSAYDGELGDAIKEINAVIGENQARRENLQDQYMREVLDAVLNGNHGELWSKLSESQQGTLTAMSEEYAKQMARYEESGRTDTEAGAELGSLYEQAKALGEAYFNNSDEVKRLNDIELEEIDAIREATAGLADATQASYRLSQELSKGLGAVTLSDYGSDLGASVPFSSQDWTDDGGGLHGPSTLAGDGWYDDGGNFHSHAFGLERVPHDDYPALLHEGERVLTAAEARSRDEGRGGLPPIQLTITGNSFNGTSEEMADQLWEIIVRKLEQAYIAAEPK